MMKKVSKCSINKITTFDIVNNITMVFVIFITLYPMLYILFASLSDPMELMALDGKPLLYPIGFNFGSYKSVFQNHQLMTGMRNSILYLAISLVNSMVFTSVGAYFLSRKNVYFKKPIFMLILITMYFSGGLVPTFLAIKSYGLYDTMWALILPGTINTYNMIILKVGFEGIPDSLEEAAKIDGAGAFWIFMNIVLPLSKASLAVITLYYAVSGWNSWFPAMIYLSDRELYPAQLVLRQILIENSTNDMTGGAAISDRASMSETVKYAVIIFTTLPILLVYPFVQKYFIKGVMIGAVKG